MQNNVHNVQASIAYWIQDYHIEAETKWTPFSRRHFQMDFLEWKCMNFDKKNSSKFVPMGPINNIPVLVQIMAWRRQGDKPLSEPMTVSLLTHIGVTLPQWVKKKSMGLCYLWYILRIIHTICASLGLDADRFIKVFHDYATSLQWCHNECDGVSNHRPLGRLLNRLFRRRSKKASKLPVTVIGIHRWPVSNAKNVSIWLHHTHRCVHMAVPISINNMNNMGKWFALTRQWMLIKAKTIRNVIELKTCITVTSNEIRVVSNQWRFGCPFNSLFPADMKNKTLHYQPLMRESISISANYAENIYIS